MKEPRKDDDLGLDRIEAESVTLQVVDSKTGRAFTRKLPLTYQENDNGILLIGEDPTGKISTIAFLSATALEKMRNLTGKGPDASLCD